MKEGPDRLRQGDRRGLRGSDETRQGTGEGVHRQENESVLEFGYHHYCQTNRPKTFIPPRLPK